MQLHSIATLDLKVLHCDKETTKTKSTKHGEPGAADRAEVLLQIFAAVLKTCCIALHRPIAQVCDANLRPLK